MNMLRPLEEVSYHIAALGNEMFCRDELGNCGLKPSTGVIMSDRVLGRIEKIRHICM